MTIRFYILPLDVSQPGYRGPKYLKWRFNPDGLDVPWSLIDFGFEPTCMVAADVAPADHTALSANADVVSAPQNIDSAIASDGARDTVRAALESLNVPAGWVQTGMIYREVLRPCAHLFLFAQRYFAKTGRRMIEPGYTLNTLIGDLPQAVRTGLMDTADELGYSRDGVTLGMTYRQGLKVLGDQWGARPVKFSDLTVL